MWPKTPLILHSPLVLPAVSYKSPVFCCRFQTSTSWWSGRTMTSMRSWTARRSSMSLVSPDGSIRRSTGSSSTATLVCWPCECTTRWVVVVICKGGFYLIIQCCSLCPFVCYFILILWYPVAMLSYCNLNIVLQSLAYRIAIWCNLIIFIISFYKSIGHP